MLRDGIVTVTFAGIIVDVVIIFSQKYFDCLDAAIFLSEYPWLEM